MLILLTTKNQDALEVTHHIDSLTAETIAMPDNLSFPRAAHA